MSAGRPAADRNESPATLTVSVVVYRSPGDVLERTLASLAAAVRHACERGALRDVQLSLVDNAGDAPDELDAVVARACAALPGGPPRILRGHGNVGYGRGHNLALRPSTADFHLVLNPDVILEPDALAEAVAFMRAHPAVTVLAPQVRGDSGDREYLCKRYPSVLLLLLRGFAPPALRRPFARLLARYEMRDVIADAVVMDPPIVSGCFMFLRHGGRAPANGFADHYFLYFEDFDYSLRAAREGRLAYVPQVRITHFGGNSARKGLHHARLFARSGLTFFREHGWRWV